MSSFKCDFCDNMYTYKRGLNRHIKMKHGDNGKLAIESEESNNDIDDKDEENDEGVEEENSETGTEDGLGNDEENSDEDEDNENDVDDKDDEWMEDENVDRKAEEKVKECLNMMNNCEEVESEMEEQGTIRDYGIELMRKINIFMERNKNENLLKKYIGFLKLLVNVNDDLTHQTVLKVKEHFENDLNIIYASQECAINLLKPMLREVIYDDRKEPFWDSMMKLEIETPQNATKKDVAKGVIKKYSELLELIHEAKNNKFHKKIRCLKRKIVGENEMMEMNAYKLVVKKLKLLFDDMEEEIEEGEEYEE